MLRNVSNIFYVTYHLYNTNRRTYSLVQNLLIVYSDNGSITMLRTIMMNLENILTFKESSGGNKVH